MCDALCINKNNKTLDLCTQGQGHGVTVKLLKRYYPSSICS